MAKGVKTGGRKAGTPNKITATVKQAFEEAFTKLQEDDNANIVAWAVRNPTEFYKLAAKLIPSEMNVQGGLQVEVFTGMPEPGEDLLG